MATHTDLYLITTLTNLHAGRGDSNYGIVDNEVQRDPILNLPVIFASSLKGALRERFERNAEELKDSKFAEQIINIFGNEVKNAAVVKPGKYIFHEARLLSLPVRADIQPFYNATTTNIITELHASFSTFVSGRNDWSKALEEAAKLSFSTASASSSDQIDEFSANSMEPATMDKIKALCSKKLLDYPFVVFPNANFKQICERLPVIARNQLENGVSKNLFYEEVVPRQSRFVFFVERPNDDDYLNHHLSTAFNNRVQIGANASIGYGVCKIERLFTTASQAQNTQK
jgi:CRISPR-associated protein Cmr4